MLHQKIRYLEGRGKWCKYLPAFTWTKLYMRHKYFVQLIFTVINILNSCMRPQTAPQDASSGLRAQARLSCRFNFNQIQSVFQVPQHLVITSIFHSCWERLIAQVSAQIFISSNSRKIWANILMGMNLARNNDSVLKWCMMLVEWLCLGRADRTNATFLSNDQRARKPLVA